MTLRKRLFSSALCFLLLLSMVPLQASAVTRQEATDWLESKVGEPVGSGECVAFVRAYYKDVFGASVSGDAKDYRNNAPAGWTKIPYTSSNFSVQTGDVAVWTSTNYSAASKKYGHVGIVNKATSNGFTYYDQNPHPVRNNASFTYGRSGWDFWGVIRPPITSTTIETVSVAEDTYVLRNGNKYLSAPNDKDGGDVTMSATSDTKQQQFTIKKSGSAYYIISDASSSNRVLNVYSDSVSASGMKITLYKQVGVANQKWVFEKNGDGYLIHPSDNTDVALDLKSDGSLKLAASKATSGEIWYLESVGAGESPTPEAPPTPDPIPDPDPAPTPVPDEKGLRGIVTSVGVKFDWNGSNRSIGYRIFRSTTPDDQGLSITDFPIQGNEYVDPNVNEYTTYYYTIREVLTETSFDPATMELVPEQLGTAVPPIEVKVEALTTDKASTKHFMLMQLGKETMLVDGDTVEIDPGRGTTPQVIQGRTLVPIRAVIETMAGAVDWDGADQKVTLEANGHRVEMWLGSKDIMVDDEPMTMDVAPDVINERTMLPVRFVAENVGCQIEWIGSTGQIIIVFYLEQS